MITKLIELAYITMNEYNVDKIKYIYCRKTSIFYQKTFQLSFKCQMNLLCLQTPPRPASYLYNYETHAEKK